MKVFMNPFLVAILLMFPAVGFSQDKQPVTDISEFSDLVLEDQELNLIKDPTWGVAYSYESNHLFYNLRGLELSLTRPLSEKFSISMGLGYFSSIDNKILVAYYLAQDPHYNIDSYYPRPNIYGDLGFEYQFLSSRVNFFDKASIPLSLGLQLGVFVENYENQSQRYFYSYGCIFRLLPFHGWGFSFQVKGRAGVSPSESRISYLVGPYFVF